MVDRGSQAIDILIESERHFNCEPPDNGWLEKNEKTEIQFQTIRFANGPQPQDYACFLLTLNQISVERSRLLNPNDIDRAWRSFLSSLHFLLQTMSHCLRVAKNLQEKRDLTYHDLTAKYRAFSYQFPQMRYPG
jgi:hypothetical protein